MREGARGQPKRILQDSASGRDQHCNGGQRLGRKSEVGTSGNSQVAGAVGVSLAAGCSWPETVIATDPMFPKGNTRVAARKGELQEQIAEAFC